MNFTDDMEVTTMKSAEGEEVLLEDIIDTVAARGQVEKWLVELETDMKKSVRQQVILLIARFKLHQIYPFKNHFHFIKLSSKP